MKRIARRIESALLLVATIGWASACQGDTLLRYAAPHDEKDTVVIEASARGDLREVGRGSIGASRFELPQTPLSREQLRGLMTP